MKYYCAWVGLLCSAACTGDLPDGSGLESSSTTSSASSDGGSSSESSSRGESTASVDPDSTTASIDGGTESTTTGPPPQCVEPDGTYDGACPTEAPFCVEGQCVPCSDELPLASCDVDQGAPGAVCDADGSCVVCNEQDTTACSGSTPVCDSDTNACVPCTEHSQCGMAACNLFTGECVQGMVFNVVPGAGALAAAVVAVGDSGTIVLADGIYDEALTIGSGATVAFLAAPAATPQWRRTVGVGAPQLRVTGGATVLLDGINVQLNDSNTDPAIRIDSAGSRFWVDRSTISQNFGVGVRAEGQAQLMMRNCFVGGSNNVDALDVTGSMAELHYSTIGAAFGSSSAIFCDAAATVTVSDSILIAQDSTAEVECDVIVVDHTATNEMVLAGEGNVTVGQTDETWFADYAAGDLHLVGNGPATFMEIAQWDEGDPSVDIDGMPRSGVPGTLEHAGADLP